MKDVAAQPDLIERQLTDDERAVDAVISQEIDAFFSKDFEAWSACYLHSPRLRSTMMSHDLGLDVREGWEAHVDGTRLHFESEPVEDARWSKTVDQITVRGDMAWLTCRARTDTSLCMMGESFETWVLERHGGDWKVVCVNVMAVHAHGGESFRIALDAEGRIVGLGANAKRHVDRHPGFVIRDGRLHAVDRDVDRNLREAIGRASALHGYFEQAAYAEMEGQRFAYPLILEREDGEGHEVILITVQDRHTYVNFGISDEAMANLDASAAIFDLSENQHRIALGVFRGQSLPEIAASMGISPATAKTHLQRAYQKTGTASQTALVRCLPSVG